jgi:general secretion pathway protein D
MQRYWSRRAFPRLRAASLVTCALACAALAHDAAAQGGGAMRPAVPLAGVTGGGVTTTPTGTAGAGNVTSAPPANRTGGAPGATGGTTGATGAAPGAAGGAGATAGGKTQADTNSLPQFESGVEFEPRSPNYKVSFSLEDADLNELVRVIGQLTGKRFIFGGKVRNIKASIYSPQKVTVAEAYQAFLSILETNGLTVVPHGRFLKIVETGGIASQDTPTYGSGQVAPSEDRYVTRLLRLQHASAEEVANILGHFKSKDGDITVHPGGNLLIITDTGSNLRRMMQIIDEVDVGSSGDQMWIEGLHYAAASDVASRINEIFDLKGASGGKPGDKGGAGVSLGDAHVTKVMAEDRSNSVIIVATERAYLRILEFIKRIDVPQTGGEGEIHVIPLQHADALELVKTLNDIVSGAASAGQPGGAAAGKAGAPSPIFEGGIKVSADKATNSIVVTSSLRDYASLRAVVDRLDQARRQVFIEAVIMDLSVNRTDTLGVSFHGGIADTLFGGSSNSLLYGGLNPLSSALTPNPADLQGLALGLRGPNIPGSGAALGTGVDIPAFGVIISALSTTGDVDVLSTPHILATDNEKAIISVGENVPLQQNIPSLPTSGAGTTGFNPFSFGGVSPQRQDVGTKIEITPHLNSSNEVRLDLIETISEAREPQGTLGVVPITQRNATTKLVVQDQQTVVIGGLMRNRLAHSEQKIPVLGDIPVLGALFRKSTNVMQKTNLILVLTPYIIREQNDLRVIFERKMQERQEFLDRYFVFSDHPDYQPPKDYSRTNGLLEEIKETYRLEDERARLDEIMRPKEIKTHSPGEPLDLPVRPGPAGGTIASPPPGGATGAPPAPPPNVNVAPAVRQVDRTER